MKKPTPGTALLLILILAACGLEAQELRSELDSMVAAERAFARLSAEKGIKESFLANLGDDAILFRPNAVQGKEWMEKNPAPVAQLTWEPAFADVAGAGDLGYTTGPWEIRRTPQDPPGGFGHYVTLWRKQANGQWKVALDTGIGHAAAPKPGPVASPRITGQPQKARTDKEAQAAQAALREAELRFPTTSEAYASTLAPEARVYRNESFPFVGQAASRSALTAAKGSFKWTLQDVRVSTSADLGYAYGTVDFKPADASKPVESTNFVRIWKKQANGAWKVVLDVLS